MDKTFQNLNDMRKILNTYENFENDLRSNLKDLLIYKIQKQNIMEKKLIDLRKIVDDMKKNVLVRRTNIAPIFSKNKALFEQKTFYSFLVRDIFVIIYSAHFHFIIAKKCQRRN